VTQGAVVCPQWYALQIAPKRLFTIQAALERRGIETYLPVFTVEVKWSDRVKVVERPLFPGYVIARFSLTAAPEILAIAGVIQILNNNLHPEAIDDAEIASLRRVLADVLRPSEPCAFALGEKVRIESGPLAGVTGMVVRTKGQQRLVIGISLLNRAVAVELDAADVVAVSC